VVVLKLHLDQPGRYAVVRGLDSLDPLCVWADMRMRLLTQPANRDVMRLVIDQTLPLVRERLDCPPLLAAFGGRRV
jgi:hypothetical protein